MKKLMMMAMMLVASATAFAGDSEALKAILKTKTYTEAQTLLDQTIGQLASDKEKAKAYNQVAKLAYEVYSHESDIETTNRAMGKNDPVDKPAMYAAAYASLKAAIECDKYDQKPNEKGKVKLDFRQANQDHAPALRIALLYAAQDAFGSEDYQTAYNNASFYITSLDETLLAEYDKIDRSANMGLAAYFASYSAYNLKDMANTGKYARIGVKDEEPQVRDFCFRLLVESLRHGNMETAADTARYINDVQQLYAEFPDKDQLYATLSDIYMSKGDYESVIRVADERLAAYATETLPHAYKGSCYMTQQKYEQAIEAFKNIPEGDRNYLLAQYNIGSCYYNMATELNEQLSDKQTNTIKKEDDAKVKEITAQAKEYLERVWQEDPQFERRKLIYLLYSVYYRLGEEAKAEEMSKLLDAE